LRGVLGRSRAYSPDAHVFNYTCYSLPHRTLLKLEGRDTNSFLQGIITNDTGLLEEPGQRALYAHMLNVQGRTLYDIILYRYFHESPVCAFVLLLNNDEVLACVQNVFDWLVLYLFCLKSLDLKCLSLISHSLLNTFNNVSLVPCPWFKLCPVSLACFQPKRCDGEQPSPGV